MSNHIWKIKPQIGIEKIEKYSNIHPVILQLLHNRGLKTQEEINEFFEGDELNDPFIFTDMKEAVELTIYHIKTKNKICIYGDYDADGVTSSAILFEIFKTFKVDVSVYIPDRVSEGYGLNERAIKEIVNSNVKLIITVDGGIRNKKEVELAKNLGIDVIITDHHIPPEKEDELPRCLIINPNIKNEIYPFKQLSGAGVALKFATALIFSSKLTQEDKDKILKRSFDLAAIGTVADCVLLLGENRIIVKKGLEIINSKKRLGLHQLIEIAALNGTKKIDSWNIGFQIAPRLNAAGRMDHANTSFELLVTDNQEEALFLAKRLNDHNQDRQKLTEEIFSEVETQIKNNEMIIIGICPEKIEKESWQEGIIGLVAGRFVEKYYRPAIVITATEEGYKGSGRSIEEFNIIEAISECAEFLEKYGGHPAACGFSLKKENLESFVNKIKKIAKEKLFEFDLSPKLNIESEIDLKDLDDRLVEQIELFGPFGQGNDKPKLLSREVRVLDIINMGNNNQHIKLRLKNEYSKIFNAIGFGQSALWTNLKIGDKIDIVYYVEINEFNGKREVQMKIIDLEIKN